MALTSTLFTGLSGLDVNQTRLNVVGNNIANVNTVAFKASRSLNKPQFYITDNAGSPPSSEFGGANPSQRGLGATVSGIEKDFSGGPIEPTGRATDLALDGEGFFVVQGEEQRYTRDGSFKLNSQNTLVTTSGEFVQGYGIDDNFDIIPGQLQNIEIPLGVLTLAQATASVQFQGNLNSGGDLAAGSSILNSQAITTLGGGAAPAGATLLTQLASTTDNATPLFALNDVMTLQGTKGGAELPAATFTVNAGSTLNDLLTFFNQGLGIDTTVAPPAGVATPGADIKPDGGGDPNSIQLVIAANTGTFNRLSLDGGAFSNQAAGRPFLFADGSDGSAPPIESNPVGESIRTSLIAYDSLGNALNIDVTMVLEQKTDLGTTWRYYASSGEDTDLDLVLGNGTLDFDSNGRLLTENPPPIRLDRAATGAVSPMDIRLDFSSVTALSDRDSQLVATGQDGSPIGTLSDFSIGADGRITGSFTNGQTRTLGQLAVATFKNPQGLIDNGGNFFSVGGASGPPVINAPLTLGAGAVRSGALELSNVDLSREFTSLIVASTGFSAASRVISTSDQLIQELLNAAR